MLSARARQFRREAALKDSKPSVRRPRYKSTPHWSAPWRMMKSRDAIGATSPLSPTNERPCQDNMASRSNLEARVSPRGHRHIVTPRLHTVSGTREEEDEDDDTGSIDAHHPFYRDGDTAGHGRGNRGRRVRTSKAFRPTGIITAFGTSRRGRRLRVNYTVDRRFSQPDTPRRMIHTTPQSPRPTVRETPPPKSMLGKR